MSAADDPCVEAAAEAAARARHEHRRVTQNRTLTWDADIELIRSEFRTEAKFYLTAALPHLAAADAATPAHTLPPRNVIAKRLYAHRVSDHAADMAPAIWDLCLSAADDLLALLADQPTVAEVRAQALDDHRRRVVRFMPPGLVDRATVIADLEDYAARERGEQS